MISKEKFIKIISHIQKQYDNDNKFANFMEEYLDGRFVPMMNAENHIAILELWSLAVEEEEYNNDLGNWLEWFMYDCNFGKEPLTATVNNIEYIVDSIDVFYELICAYKEGKNEKG